jgi:PIN domain nuclease of toxin-antitoxin system
MRVLLDTHAFLWFMADNPRLSQNARQLIEADNEVFLSIASLWEIAIKMSIGKLKLDRPFHELAPQLPQNNIQLLGITPAHLAAVSTMPLHHRDPFDRLLIAQSLHEVMPIISADAAFDAYDVTRLW